MSDLITVRVQIGLSKLKRFHKTLPQDSTVDDLRYIIRQNPDLEISPSDGVVLISNGQSLKNPCITLADLGVCNDSLIICVISKDSGREIKQILDEDDRKYKNNTVSPVLECVFTTRPFGFAVWADERGKNAIVTKVIGKKSLELGVKIGYCVYKVNDHVAFNQSHGEVLGYLREMKCPLLVTFIDLAREYSITFEFKPLGFTVTRDKEGNNAKVFKVHKKARNKGVRIGSYITAVNNLYVFGLGHQEIISIINNARFPIILRFRRPPKLLVIRSKKKKKSTSS